MEKKLVFVLGAGASSHFGYPLGSELIDAMDKFLKLIHARNQSEYATDNSVIEARNFLADIESYNPLNIDYYFHNNPEQEPVGKKLLEATILHCQNLLLFRHNTKEEVWWRKTVITENKVYFSSANWVKFIHHKIAANCKTVDDIKHELSNITIITFNYDLSFEQALWKYFSKSKFKGIEDYLFNEFFLKNIIHIYGKVTRKDNSGKVVVESYECSEFDKDGKKAFELFIRSRGESINIIGVDKSKPNTDAIDALSKANLVYFLGYSFDEFNNNVIGLKEFLKHNGNLNNFYYTNYCDGTIVDSKVRSFFDGWVFKSFGADTRITQAFHTDVRKVDIIKSKKTVYDALEHDLFIPIM